MTDTDRAFIAAFQRKSGVVATPVGAGPHFQQAATKAPRRARLSELMATRETGGSVIDQTVIAQPVVTAPPLMEIPAPRAQQAGIQIESFAWPGVVDHLCEDAQTQLADVLDAIYSLERRCVALVAAEAEVGLTTLVLSLARLAGRAGLSVAMLDANPADQGIAGALGFRRLPSLHETLQRGLLREAAEVRAEQDRASLVVAGSGWGVPSATEALEDFAHDYDLVILDLGVVQENHTQNAWASAGAPALIVEEAASQSDDRKRVVARLGDAGARVLGVVQNLAA